MSDYEFRNSNSREDEAFTTFLVEERGYSRQEAESIVDNAHVGILEGYQGSTPSFRGKLMMVVHENITMYNAYDCFTVEDEDSERLKVEAVTKEG